MGRKKKKPLKPWCWYCNREFEDEKILVQHQKARHFKCHVCHKKLYTAPGLVIHCMQVHKETVNTVPNSLPHRNNCEIEIYGTEGIPPEDVTLHEKEMRDKEKGDKEDDVKPPLPDNMMAGMMPGMMFGPGGMPIPPAMMQQMQMNPQMMQQMQAQMKAMQSQMANGQMPPQMRGMMPPVVRPPPRPGMPPPPPGPPNMAHRPPHLMNQPPPGPPRQDRPPPPRPPAPGRPGPPPSLSSIQPPPGPPRLPPPGPPQRPPGHARPMLFPSAGVNGNSNLPPPPPAKPQNEDIPPIKPTLINNCQKLIYADDDLSMEERRAISRRRGAPNTSTISAQPIHHRAPPTRTY